MQCTFSSILTWIAKPSHSYDPLHWGFTVLLFFVYPAIGFSLGGLSGLVYFMVAGKFSFFKKLDAMLISRAILTSTAVFIFIINLTIQLPLK